jgi:hypothetical protein
MKEQSTLGEQSGTNTVGLGRSGSLMEEGVGWAGQSDVF